MSHCQVTHKKSQDQRISHASCWQKLMCLLTENCWDQSYLLTHIPVERSWCVYWQETAGTSHTCWHKYLLTEVDVFTDRKLLVPVIPVDSYTCWQKLMWLLTGNCFHHTCWQKLMCLLTGNCWDQSYLLTHIPVDRSWSVYWQENCFHHTCTQKLMCLLTETAWSDNTCTQTLMCLLIGNCLEQSYLRLKLKCLLPENCPVQTYLFRSKRQEIKRTLFNWMKQDKTCKFLRKSSFSSYVKHKNRKTNN